jgi:hypothetical protein
LVWETVKLLPSVVLMKTTKWDLEVCREQRYNTFDVIIMGITVLLQPLNVLPLSCTPLVMVTFVFSCPLMH